jgi:hypothetical protein
MCCAGDAQIMFKSVHVPTDTVFSFQYQTTTTLTGCTCQQATTVAFRAAFSRDLVAQTYKQRRKEHAGMFKLTSDSDTAGIRELANSELDHVAAGSLLAGIPIVGGLLSGIVAGALSGLVLGGVVNQQAVNDELLG